MITTVTSEVTQSMRNMIATQRMNPSRDNQPVSTIDPGNTLQDSTIQNTIRVSGSRGAGEKDESYITEHGN
ncbi:hypothetical protein X777_09221 [Ooceraea biroi]|uniref:Uncharacterized protein n=1 Tax=Ooceraea biroi TaxID=2015173 RepID=A0A026W8D4_OOCBI|nr:hypothetical protein X777_09221 [Ooceraea biroi]